MNDIYDMTAGVCVSYRLRTALERLNPALPPEAITAAVDELTRDLLLPRLLSGRFRWRVARTIRQVRRLYESNLQHLL